MFAVLEAFVGLLCVAHSRDLCILCSPCRENRAKIDVPTKAESAQLLLLPLGVAALWAFNYFAFVQ